MIISEADHLAHYGILRRSGRYPWGSGGDENHGRQDTAVIGENVTDRSRSFLGAIAVLRKEGMSDKDIADGFGMKTTEFRSISSIAKNEKRQADVNLAQRLKDKGYSNTAIGTRIGVPESTVRALLAPGVQDRLDVLKSTSNMLKDQIDEKKYIDIGSGTEYHLAISREKLDAAVAQLRSEGYTQHYLKIEQLGTGKNTSQKVLAAPGVTYSEVYANRGNIAVPFAYSEDGGRSFLNKRTLPPISISSKRVGIRYAEDGGGQADGVTYVRPGIKDVSLGGTPYAQVRIAVDGTHYIKGMAMYKNDLPPGVDLQFNTNKSNTGNKLDALKPMKTIDGKPDGPIDPKNPFGASVQRQIIEKNHKGEEKVTSVMNILNEEGDWANWSRSLSSQFLSKQSPTLIKSQLDMKYESKQTEFDSIKELTNPSVRRLLMMKFADGADSSAVHLKAAALPRQGTHVILPLESMKETEIYAPNFRNGEKVVLIRHPHAGVFEIPQLTVNNNHPESKTIVGRAQDAVVIHPNVAKKLSGADFDGDAVLVIPNNAGKVKTAPALEKLKDFDPQRAYPEYPGMKRMTPRETQTEMGMISNLITDMTIQRAGTDDLARAVRHSMVVIDAEKHGLDFRQSARDNGITQLKIKYQESPRGGAATLISRAKSELRVPDRRPRIAKNGGPIDKQTGELKYEPTGKSFIDKNGNVVFNTVKSTKLAETNDARTLLSKDGGTTVEKIYADHSNNLKALANKARLEAVNTKSETVSPSAKAAYADELKSLDSKLNLALRNAPLERQAQLLANAIVTARKKDNPEISGPDLKKLRSQALEATRQRTGAGKAKIELSQREWEAIQSHAVSENKLSQILANGNLEQIKQLATPKTALVMTSTKKSRAQSMIQSGYSQAEIADALGVSITTLRSSLKGE